LWYFWWNTVVTAGATSAGTTDGTFGIIGSMGSRIGEIGTVFSTLALGGILQSTNPPVGEY
jgi:hypothetical protein